MKDSSFPHLSLLGLSHYGRWYSSGVKRSALDRDVHSCSPCGASHVVLDHVASYHCQTSFCLGRHDVRWNPWRVFREAHRTNVPLTLIRVTILTSTCWLPVCSLSRPPKLRKLIFGTSFNQSIEKCRWDKRGCTMDRSRNSIIAFVCRCFSFFLYFLPPLPLLCFLL